MIGSKEDQCEDCVDPTAKDPSILDKLAVLMIAAFAILLVLVLIFLLKYLSKVCPKVE